MRRHSWERRPLMEGGVEKPGRGNWTCTRCGLEVPMHAGYEDPEPGDEFVQDFLKQELDCDLRVVRHVMEN